MGRSNGMGFWRRMNWGQYREAWKSGEVRQHRKREAEQEIQEEQPRVRGTVADLIPLAGGGTLLVHNPSLCASDESCAIHKPSNHSMVDFPQTWRADRGLMERTCPHGIGHPDPDDLAFKKRDLGEETYNRRAYASHGCDGCCRGAYA